MHEKNDKANKKEEHDIMGKNTRKGRSNLQTAVKGSRWGKRRNRRKSSKPEVDGTAR